jgi:hypothetical protein
VIVREKVAHLRRDGAARTLRKCLFWEREEVPVKTRARPVVGSGKPKREAK